MRITRELLLKIAEDTVAERTRSDSNIIGAFLIGTVLDGEPLLGGTADIDLVFVYPDVNQYREVVRLTEDVHLDILHHGKKEYEPARELRLSPWKGTTIYACKPLFDPEHFLDFTQASVRGLFHHPDNVMGRSAPLLEAARSTWIGFHNNPPEYGPEQVWDFLIALENVANAVACLSGSPLTERRFLINFSACAEDVGYSGLFPGLLGLLGGAKLDADDIESWLLHWEEAYDAVVELARPPVHLHQHRRAYYRRAFNELLTADYPQVVLWPLMRTWTMAARQLPTEALPLIAWQRVCEHLRLTGDGFEERLAGLDAYLDRVEEIFEKWRQEKGA